MLGIVDVAGLRAVGNKIRCRMEEGAGVEPLRRLSPLRERNRDRLHPAVVRYAAWNAAISAAADWRETVAEAANGAS